MKKKLVTLSLAAVMATSALPVSVFAKDLAVPKEGTTVEDLLKEAVYVNDTKEKKPTKITLDSGDFELAEDETKQLNATVEPSDANKELEWSTSDQNVATVANGLVTAGKAGDKDKTAKITVTSKADSNVKAEVTVTLKAKKVEEKKPTKITLDSGDFELVEDETKQLNATVEPSDVENKNIIWSSNKNSVAEVDNSGKVTAKAVGEATITATCEADSSFKATVKVKVNPKKIIAKGITNVTVYYNRVEGKAEPGSTVRLYFDGSQVGESATASSTGAFTIYHNFGSRDSRYWDWDDYYRRYGYYPDRYYDGYYYNYYYNLNRYSLKSFDGLKELSPYSITNSDGHNYNYYYDGKYHDRYYYDYKVYPTSLSLDRSRDIVSGYLKSYPNRYVAVYRNGSFLGSDYVDSNGYFNIRLNSYVFSTSDLDFYIDRNKTKETSKTTTKTSDNKTYKTVITIGSSTISQRINGVDRTTKMDVEAYIKDGRTMLPIRFIAESLGYDVTYRDATRSAIITDGKDIIIFYLDSADFYVNGVKKQFQVKPEIKNDRTMLPISEVAKALGLSHGDKGSGKNIEWDNSTRTVVIELNK